MKSSKSFELVFVVCSLSAGVTFGQVVTTNPLDAMKSSLQRVLEEAGQPFSPEQNRALTLVMEEQRQASERLFGDIMDFSSGPVRGADRDRALSGIQWMNEQFEAKLKEVLRPEQVQIWAAFRAAEIRSQGGLAALRLVLSGAGAPLSADQDQRAATAFERAAQGLRRTEEGAATPESRAAIENNALEQVSDLLTAPQARAVLAALAGAPPAADGPGGQASTRADDDAPPAEAGVEGHADQRRREALLEALRAVAPPSANFVRTPGAMPGNASSEQIAQIRINNNPYSAENFGGRGNPMFNFGGGGGGFSGGGGGFGGFGGGGGREGGGGPDRGRGGRGGDSGRTSIEVIQRGGVGDYHGNFSFDFRDEMLTAPNAFANNKPPFQQRNINANVSGPFIPNVLTASLTFNQNEQENADTVVATTPTGDLSLGIVRPAVNRSYSGNGQMQLSPAHALHFTARYSNRNSENNGIGGFTLPERGWLAKGSDMSAGLREMWAMSPRVMHEVIFSVFGNNSENASVTRAVKIDVLDAFRSGGAGQDNRRRSRNYTLTNLLWYEGERVSIKTGTEFNIRKSTSFSEEGFLGYFTFSNLDDFRAGLPLTYRIVQGDPDLRVRQNESGLFLQTDWRINRRFTFFAGTRYEWQSNVSDYNNLDPRVAVAYALGSSTVLRGGVGLFHQNFNLNTYEEVIRLDGQRQYEIVVSNPSYPDPFVTGSAAVRPTSRRVLAPDFDLPYETRMSLSVERTLRWNLAVDSAFEFNRVAARHLSRNLNAPLPDTAVRPMPDQGNVLQLESKGRSQSRSLRIGVRQRLTFLTYNAGWTLSSDYNDGDHPFYLPMNNDDPRADWGRAGFNSRHRYNLTVNTRAPFGTLVTVSGNGHSGMPYNITTGRDDNGDQNTNDRPSGVSRNSANGPKFFNIDATLSKTFRLGGQGGDGGRQLSVYANIDNAFNLVNLRNPSGVMTSSFFGIPTSAASARDIEIGVRYQF
ncbi:MAG: TonB-dependent receptor domain-containing protein [Acidobacteriota bacterium]